MARQCTVCAHPKQRDIDRLLMDPNVTYSSVGEAFQINPKSLERHHKNHLEPRLQKVEGMRSGDVEASFGILGDMDDLKARALKLLEAAENAGQTRTAIAAIKEVRGVLDSLAKLTGEGQRTGTVVNIINAPAWTVVQTRIIHALQPFPEARQAVVQALEHMTDGS